jgi:3-phenylpropionate/trans-cinnamate dioxygenase ferredoxin subunit
MTGAYAALIAVADFPADGVHVATVNGWRVFVAKINDAFYAVNDRCSHAASMLSPGRIRGGHVMCPLHSARFNLATGACAGGAYPPIRTFPLRVVDGVIEVAVPVEAPGPSDLAVSAEQL